MRLITTSETAKLCRISVRTVKELVSLDLIIAIRIGRRVLIDQDTLEAQIARDGGIPSAWETTKKHRVVTPQDQTLETP